MIRAFSPVMACILAACSSLSLLGMQLNGPGKGYVIHVSSAGTATDKTAATELQHYLREMSGVTLPIVSAVPAGKGALYLGHSPEVASRVPDLDLKALAPDRIVVRAVGDDLVITGAAPRGTLYAAHTFLEDCLGVRWWTSKAEHVPRNSRLSFRAPAIDYTPPFHMREAYYVDIIENPRFCVRMKNNGHHGNIPPSWGGNKEVLGFVHTFWRLIPTETYFKDHPEWFSLVRGRRVPGGAGKGQLCLTNEAMRKELVKNASLWLRKSTHGHLISISQNDVMSDCCECPSCSALAARAGQSGVLVDFCNRVAADLEKEFPDVLVETLAYYYTLAPPKGIRPRHNVVIRFAPITCDFGHPMDGSDGGSYNRPFADNLRGWHGVASQLAMWNYTANYANYFIPHPNFRNLDRDLRFFRDMGVTMVFEEGGPLDSEMNSFAALSVWVLSKLLWNPDLKTEDLVNEFLAGYYQGGAGAVRKAYDLMMSSYETHGGILRTSVNGCGWFPEDRIRQAQSILGRELERQKSDAELVRRLRLVKATFDFGWLDGISADSLADARVKSEASSLLTELEGLVRQYGIRYHGENRPVGPYLARLRRNLQGIADRKSGDVPPFCRDLPETSWYEFPPATFRLHHLGTQTHLLRDESAASGQFARLDQEANWLLQMQLPRGRWRVMVALRARSKERTDTAFGDCGFYNEVAGRNEHVRRLTLADYARDGFVWLDMGVMDVVTGYLFLAPLTTPRCSGIDVERIVLVKSAK